MIGEQRQMEAGELFRLHSSFGHVSPINLALSSFCCVLVDSRVFCASLWDCVRVVPTQRKSICGVGNNHPSKWLTHKILAKRTWSLLAQVCACVCVCVCVSVCVKGGGGHKKLHDEVSLVLFHSQLLLFTCLHCRSNTFKTLLLCEPCA